jgi:hypothetical protein
LACVVVSWGRERDGNLLIAAKVPVIYFFDKKIIGELLFYFILFYILVFGLL